MEDASIWPDGREPEIGFSDKAMLDAEGVAHLELVHALILKRIEKLRSEGKDTPETRLHWEGLVRPDFSGMSDDERETVETEIRETREDPEFRARIKQQLEESDPELAELMDEDGEPDAERD